MMTKTPLLLPFFPLIPIFPPFFPFSSLLLKTRFHCCHPSYSRIHGVALPRLKSVILDPQAYESGSHLCNANLACCFLL